MNIKLEVEYVDETELAWLLDYEGTEYWVPKSLCILKDDEMTLPEWLAIDKGMI